MKNLLSEWVQSPHIVVIVVTEDNPGISDNFTESLVAPIELSMSRTETLPLPSRFARYWQGETEHLEITTRADTRERTALLFVNADH